MQTSSCKVASRSCKPTTANFDLGLFGLAPLSHIRKLFFTNLRGCSLHLQVHFRVDNFLLSGQNVTCTHGFVLQSDWYRQSQALEVDSFSCGCYQAFSFPGFRGESLGMGLGQWGPLPGDTTYSMTGLYLELLPWWPCRTPLQG